MRKSERPRSNEPLESFFSESGAPIFPSAHFPVERYASSTELAAVASPASSAEIASFTGGASRSKGLDGLHPLHATAPQSAPHVARTETRRALRTCASGLSRARSPQVREEHDQAQRPERRDHREHDFSGRPRLAPRRVEEERIVEEKRERREEGDPKHVIVDGLDALAELFAHHLGETRGDLVDARRALLGAHDRSARRLRDLRELRLAFGTELGRERLAVVV